jgi:hypothetical protein
MLYATTVLVPSFLYGCDNHLAGQKFHEDEEVKNEVMTWLCVQAAAFYDIRLKNLYPG